MISGTAMCAAAADMRRTAHPDTAQSAARGWMRSENMNNRAGMQCRAALRVYRSMVRDEISMCRYMAAIAWLHAQYFRIGMQSGKGKIGYD